MEDMIGSYGHTKHTNAVPHSKHNRWAFETTQNGLGYNTDGQNMTKRECVHVCIYQYLVDTDTLKVG